MKFFRNKDTSENKEKDTFEPVISNEENVADLVGKSITGDIEAFGHLYHIFVEQIYRYIFYQVKDKMIAEDITEDVFIKAWNAIESCKGRGHTFSAWLYRIAHNHLIDSFRSRKKEFLIETEVINEVVATEIRIEKELEKEDLINMLNCLPPNQKQLIILKFIEGLSNKEIEEVIGKSQGAIRILQMRALATLREHLTRVDKYEK
ncbi:RNA polymerase sigma factor [Chloroflexota bacterium]